MAEEGKIAEAQKSPSTQKSKLLRSVGNKVRKAGEWINEGFQDPPGYKPPEPLTLGSVGKAIDWGLGSKESTAASKNFLERWRGRMHAVPGRLDALLNNFEISSKDSGLGVNSAFLSMNSMLLANSISSGETGMAIVNGLTSGIYGLLVSGDVAVKIRQKLRKGKA